MDIVGYIASVCIGLILGLLGGGGSILSIPILVYLFRIDVMLASAYSWFIVGITSLTGAISKHKEHLVDTRAGILFGIPSVITIFSTRKWLVHVIPDTIFQLDTFIFSKRLLLLGLFAVLMILASISMIRGRQETGTETDRSRPVLLMIQGSLIGFLTGLVGAGGGFLIIPALVLLTGLSFKTAVGTSLFIIAINSLSGFLGDVLNYPMDWPFLLTITGMAVLGILIGNAISHRLSPAHLRKAFGWFVLVMGCYILFQEILKNGS